MGDKKSLLFEQASGRWETLNHFKGANQSGQQPGEMRKAGRCGGGDDGRNGGKSSGNGNGGDVTITAAMVAERRRKRRKKVHVHFLNMHPFDRLPVCLFDHRVLMDV
jgi:hypothetical protein